MRAASRGKGFRDRKPYHPDTLAAIHGEERYICLNGLRVRAAVRGSGRPLLLIMGLLGNLDLWRPLERQLHGFRTISFDAPGVGRSEIPKLPIGMAGLAGLTDQLIAALGFDRVDVLGLSFGGAVAQQLARSSPKRVRRLVLAATMCGLGGVPGSPAALGCLLDPRVLTSRRHLERVSPTLFGGRARADPRRAAELPWGPPPSLRGYAWQLTAMTGWTSLPWLHRLPHETLVMAGDDDPLVPLANGRLLAGQIPHARLHVVRGGGHLFLLDSAQEIGPVITRFLASAGDPQHGR